MNRPRVVLASVVALAMASTGCTPEPTGAENYSHEIVLQGQRVYDQHCAGCHGVDGKGEGPAAAFLNPKPRDFTAAKFKFRSTPSSFLPTDEDLMRTLVRGVHSTSMPSWRLLSDSDRKALVQYLKTFSENWQDEEYLAPAVPLPGAPKDLDSEEWIKKGGELYVSQACYSCHGFDGSTRGASNTDLRDYKDRRIVPLNFSVRSPKGGSNPEDYYRAFTTGLDGSPMPVYAHLAPEQRWALVSYAMALKTYAGKIPDHLMPERLKELEAEFDGN